MFLPHPRVKVSIVGSLRHREVACSDSDRQGSNLESCVWRTVSSQSSHHPQEVLLAQFSLYVHKGGLKSDPFHFLLTWSCGSRQRDTISSGWKFRLNNLAVKGLMFCSIDFVHCCLHVPVGLGPTLDSKYLIILHYMMLLGGSKAIPANMRRWTNVSLLFPTIYDVGPTVSKRWANVSLSWDWTRFLVAAIVKA